MSVVHCSCSDSDSRTFALVEERMERGRDFLSSGEQKLAFALACLLNVVSARNAQWAPLCDEGRKEGKTLSLY